MRELPKSLPSLGGGAQLAPIDLAGLDRLRELKVAALAVQLQNRWRQKRREELRLSVIRLWPLVVGLLLTCVVPELHGLASRFQPWGMCLLFPFVELASRKELHLFSALAETLPHFVLYAQFPVEGLLARMVLRNRVTFSGVACQILFYHVLGATELWLLSGGLSRILAE
jgi:hypothetical protein